MDNRTTASIVDITLNTRRLRSVYLAGLLQRTLQKIRRVPQRSSVPARESGVALEWS